MIRRAVLIALAVAVAGGLMAASAGGAGAVVHRTACARHAVVRVKSFGFRPASVRPGGASTATVTAVNCTGRVQQGVEAWFAQFTRPGGGLPPGCPVMDPFLVPVRFPPHRAVSTGAGYQVWSSCTASRLIVTVDIDRQDGTVLATATASLKITHSGPGCRKAGKARRSAGDS
jgi:hypothetical protein